MRPFEKEYFTSERFIHDELAARAAAMAEQMRAEWRESRQLESYAISWPGESIKSDDGQEITHAVLMHLPATLDATEKTNALKRMVERTKAYGIALIERKGDEMRVLFETQHGAQAWFIKLERHGDILVPNPATSTRQNAECLGLLWHPN